MLTVLVSKSPPHNYSSTKPKKIIEGLISTELDFIKELLILS